MSNGNKKELRYNTELRATTSAAKGKKLSGYAAIFNSETTIDGFREVLRPGCFDRCLAGNPDVRCLSNHDQSVVLGRTRSNTLVLRTDSKGLIYEVMLPKTQAAADLWESVKRGDVDASSFGFTVADENWQPAANGQLPLRELTDVDVFDVSPCIFPAYGATSVSARSAQLFPEGLPDGVAIRKAAPESSDADERERMKFFLKFANL